MSSVPSTRRRIGALVRHEAVLLARAPGPLIGYTVMPVLLMTVLRPMLERVAALGLTTGMGGGTAQAAAGMAVMFSLFALKVVGAGFLQERTWHTWDRLGASPARRSELLIGKAVPMLMVLLVHQAIIIGFAMVVFGLRPAAAWWPLALVAIAWTGCILILGTAVATLVQSPAQLSVAGDIAAVLTSILGGALMPAELLPGWLRAVGPLSPGYWAMRSYRAALVDPSTSSLIGGLAGLGCFIALGIALSAALARRRTDG
jgi:ABC-2 type transport system permease protein